MILSICKYICQGSSKLIEMRILLRYYIFSCSFHVFYFLYSLSPSHSFTQSMCVKKEESERKRLVHGSFPLTFRTLAALCEKLNFICKSFAYDPLILAAVLCWFKAFLLLFLRSFVHISSQLIIYELTYIFICYFMYWFIHLSYWSFIYLIIYSFTYTCACLVVKYLS